MKLFPQNVTGNYITQLPHEINLQGRWSIALVEIQIPFNILHLAKEDARFACFNANAEDADYNSMTEDFKTFEMDQYYTSGKFNAMMSEIEHGFCDNIEELVSILDLRVNQVFTTMKEHIGELYGRQKNLHIDLEAVPDYHIKLKISKNNLLVAQRICDCPVDHFMCVSEKLRKILGLTEPTMQFKSQVTTFKYPIRLYRAMPDGLLVYCDLTEPHVVGDSVASLLRSVQLDNVAYGMKVVKTFATPHYYPVWKNSFRTVEIDIRDSLGKPVPFEDGTLTCALHFKKIYP